MKEAAHPLQLAFMLQQALWHASASTSDHADHLPWNAVSRRMTFHKFMTFSDLEIAGILSQFS